jgi:hypothetical protein
MNQKNHKKLRETVQTGSKSDSDSAKRFRAQRARTHQKQNNLIKKDSNRNDNDTFSL